MTRKTLLAALFLLALSGLMLHYRIHNFMVPDKLNPGAVLFDKTKFLSFLFPCIDLFLVTLLFISKRTVVYGYLFNGLLVIYGTIFMMHFSIAELTARSAPLDAWFLKSTIPDIGIAWADFFVGKALYDLHMKIK
ncbi:MAG: hypothetical protein A2Y81_07120 [Nitrospirae bacterium RBG_13_43_8]|nr:MAG: hypothetical protein A2Y81_07120 [Nitrospirae bacterium RBG_13_43_8]